MSDRRGHCLCGAVSFTIQEPKTEFGACHCSMCRQWTGSALLALEVPADKITVSGQDSIAAYRSSDWAERCFCKTCGSKLWYRVTAEGPHQGAYHLAVGLLDDLAGMKLTSEIFIDEKPDGYAFAGPLDQMTGAQVMALYSGEET
ncbi:GFA family protein [Halovulum sp. GXIMD14793]